MSEVIGQDLTIEEEIIEKGLTAPRIRPEMIDEIIVDEQYHTYPGTTFTSCLLTLENGFYVHGESACVSPDNFDIELVRKRARDNAKQQIWKLEGYLLRQKIHDGVVTSVTSSIEPEAYPEDYNPEA